MNELVKGIPVNPLFPYPFVEVSLFTTGSIVQAVQLTTIRVTEPANNRLCDRRVVPQL